MPDKIIKGDSMMLVGLYVTGIVSKALTELTTMSVDVQDTDPYTCT